MKVRTGSGGPTKARLLNAAALKDAKKKSVVVQITDVREAPKDWNARCVIDIIGFDGYGSMAMNATNTNAMVEVCGDESENWIGRQIQIGLTKTSFAGRPVDGLVITNILAKKALPKAKDPWEG